MKQVTLASSSWRGVLLHCWPWLLSLATLSLLHLSLILRPMATSPRSRWWMRRICLPTLRISSWWRWIRGLLSDEEWSTGHDGRSFCHAMENPNWQPLTARLTCFMLSPPFLAGKSRYHKMTAVSDLCLKVREKGAKQMQIKFWEINDFRTCSKVCFWQVRMFMRKMKLACLMTCCITSIASNIEHGLQLGF